MGISYESKNPTTKLLLGSGLVALVRMREESVTLNQVDEKSTLGRSRKRQRPSLS